MTASPRKRKWLHWTASILGIIVILKYAPLIYFSSFAPICLAPNISKARASEIYALARKNRNLFKATLAYSPILVNDYLSSQFAMLEPNLATPQELVLGAHAVLVNHGAISPYHKAHGALPEALSNPSSSTDGAIAYDYKINPWVFLYISLALDANISVKFQAPNIKYIGINDRAETSRSSMVIFRMDAFNVLRPDFSFVEFGTKIIKFPSYEQLSLRLNTCPEFPQIASLKYDALVQWKSGR